MSLFESSDKLIDWLGEWGAWAIIICLLLNILISIVGVIPSIVISGVNVALFGLIPGFLISWAGEIMGAAVTFWLYGKGVTIFIRKQKMDWQWQRRLREMSKRKQFWTLIVARITPVIPSGLVTLMALVSAVPFPIFFVATIIGKIPSIALETLVVHDLLYLKENSFRLLASIILLIILFCFLRKPKEETSINKN